MNKVKSQLTLAAFGFSPRKPFQRTGNVNDSGSAVINGFDEAADVEVTCC